MKDLFVVQCDVSDATDLARVATTVIERNIPILCARTDAVGMLWSWLEKTPVKIYAKFSYDGDMPRLSEKINAALKNGASGARISVDFEKLAEFADELHPIREDLFFNKDIVIDVDIYQINPSDYETLFCAIDKVRVTAMCMCARHTSKRADDFVGRVYGILSSDFKIPFYFDIANDINRAEQVWRIAEKICPKALNDLRFFING